MHRIFNEGDTVKSRWDNKDYIIVNVWGEILNCISEHGLTELMDFEVDLKIKGKSNDCL